MHHAPHSCLPARVRLAGLAAFALTVAAGSAGASPYVQLIGSQQRGDAFGVAMAVGDFNGDGLADLAVGAPDAERGVQQSTGQVYVWLGGPDPGGADVPQVVGPPEGRQRFAFGATLAAADMNGDGITDLFIGDGDGQVRAVWGVPEGEAFADGGQADLLGLQEELFGLTRLVGAGDLDGDGADELIAVRYEVDEGCLCDDGVEGGLVEVGELAVLYGDPIMLLPPVRPQRVWLPLDADEDVCDCPVSPDNGCLRVCDFGADVLADRSVGQDEPALVVGAPGVGPAGRVYVFDGFELADPYWIDGLPGGERIGRSLAWLDAPGCAEGDVDPPGLLVSADEGEVRIHPIIDDTLQVEPDPQAGFGALPGFAQPRFATGDLNLDGCSDLVVGEDGIGGDIAIYYGPLALPPGEPDRLIEGDPARGDLLGAPFAVVGQMNGAFAAELAVAVVRDAEDNLEGAVKLFIDGIIDPDDIDGDGIGNDADNCPFDSNLLQADRDGDGAGDRCDTCPADADNDIDADQVCASDCAAFYPQVPFAESPLRAMFAQGVFFEWFESEGFEQPAAPGAVVRVEQGQIAADHGVPDDEGRNALTPANANEAVALRFDPYARGRLPSHVGFAVTTTCEGGIELEATYGDGARSVYRDRFELIERPDDARFVGLKHPDGVAAVRITALCDGELYIDDVQVGRSRLPIPCQVPPRQDRADNCPDMPNADQGDQDEDGRGDACDCGIDLAQTATEQCVPVRRIRGFEGRAGCEAAGDLAGAAYAQLRADLKALGHEIEAGRRRFDADVAMETDIFVVVGEGPEGDAEICALTRFVQGGGAVLDVRDFDRSIFGAVGVGRLGVEQVVTCEARADVDFLCDGVGEVAHGVGRFIGDGFPGDPVLVDNGGQPVAIAIEDGGRAVLFADGALTWSKTACGEGAFHDPGARRVILNAIDYLAAAPGYDAVAGPLLDACFGPPVFEPVPRLVIEAGSGGEVMPLRVSDEATPIGELELAIRRADRELLTFASLNFLDSWGFTVQAGDRAGVSSVTVTATDGDGNQAALEIEVEVTCSDLDGDGVCNLVDQDRDGDGILNDGDDAPDDPTVCGDSDGDTCDDCAGPGARADRTTDGPDRDDDGLCDAGDPCPDVPGIECAPCPDIDGDAVCDDADNCPDVPNPDQADADRDRIGDACEGGEGDRDGDGLSDDFEGELGTDPDKYDSDADNLSDGEEVAIGTDPLDYDTDGDDLSDGDEVGLGTDPLDDDTDGDDLDDGDELEIDTDPLDPDSDGDELEDGEEIEYGTNPKIPDTDGDDLGDGEEVEIDTDPLDPDTDGDHFNDGDEVTWGTDPLVPDENQDGDRRPDDADNCRFVPNDNQLDRDEDGVGDACDLDDGFEDADDENQGMQLQGGCAAMPGGSHPAAPGALLLLAGLVIRRRRAGGRG